MKSQARQLTKKDVIELSMRDATPKDIRQVGGRAAYRREVSKIADETEKWFEARKKKKRANR